MPDENFGKMEIQNPEDIPEEITITEGSAFDAGSLNSRGTLRVKPHEMVIIQKVGFRPGIHQTKDP